MLVLFGKRFLLVQCVYVSERACADTLFSMTLQDISSFNPSVRASPNFNAVANLSI